MSLIEDEPRKHPKPVPFCQSPMPCATVPDVSLVLQDTFDNKIEKKNDSFSGTEFQTYNAWRWKHIRSNEEICNSEKKMLHKYSDGKECCFIKDKYSSSNLEKRKNEILYGKGEEPRRPLPPRENLEIPKSNEFLKNFSFDDAKWVQNTSEENQIKFSKLSDLKNNVQLFNYNTSFDNSEKWYNIIIEQNKQAVVLQKQIEQLLKLQETKDKQIEQLLNTQEFTEKKIEQLLQTLEIKAAELEQLLKLKDKLEQHIQDLLKTQEIKQKENSDLLKKLKNIKSKEFCTIGTMTCLQLVENSTNTSGVFLRDETCHKNDKTKEEISVLRDYNDSNEIDGKDKSLSLHSSDLPPIEECMPTPQSSIHLDIQDFHNSSDESDNDMDGVTVKSPKSSENFPLGYTFYNNVLTQVKDIIGNSGEISKESGCKKQNKKQLISVKPGTESISNKGNVQSFQAWGVNVFERGNMMEPYSKQEKIDKTDKLKYASPNLCNIDGISPSDISLKINALALKYLKQEQISQHDIYTQIPPMHHPDVTIYNVTNLSFGSMRYLDKQLLLSGKKSGAQQKLNIQQRECSPAKMLLRRKKMNLQENLNTSIGNVLDINSLNQQPKLL